MFQNPVVIQERLDDAINVLRNHAEGAILQTLQPAVPMGSSPNNISSLHSNVVQGSSQTVKNFPGVIPIQMVKILHILIYYCNIITLQKCMQQPPSCTGDSYESSNLIFTLEM